MSSSSSAPDATYPPSVRGLLSRSLDCIRRHVPTQHAAVRDAIAGIAVQLQFGDEAFDVVATESSILLGPAQPGPPVKLATTTQVVASLVDGELDLLDAVLDEALTLTGSIDNLLRFDQALLAYLHGAVRSPSSVQLLSELRTIINAKTSHPRSSRH